MSDNTQSIQWFPGHMAKTRRKIKEILPLIDAVAEVVDARIPLSSRNPEIAELIEGKPHIILLNKCDMADKVVTEEWIKYYKTKGITAIGIDCKSGKGLNFFKDTIKTVLADRLEQYAAKGMVGKPLSKVAKQGKNLQLYLGHSLVNGLPQSSLVVTEPEGITFEVPNPNTIVVKGINKQAVGQIAAVIRGKRPPEPYHGKGVKYSDEHIRRKAGKAGK